MLASPSHSVHTFSPENQRKWIRKKYWWLLLLLLLLLLFYRGNNKGTQKLLDLLLTCFCIWMNNNDSNLSFFNLFMTLDRSGQAVHPGPNIRLSYRLTGSWLELYILCAHTRMTLIWSSTLKFLLMRSFHPFLFLAVMGFHMAHTICIKKKHICQTNRYHGNIWTGAADLKCFFVFFFLLSCWKRNLCPHCFILSVPQQNLISTGKLYGAV